MHPIPRDDSYPLYWQFAAKRMEIFYLRQAGKSPPYTTDPILQQYKFCNVYRALDRESQHLIRDAAYCGDQDPTDRIFQIVLYRFFSRWDTWCGLVEILGRAPRVADLSNGELEQALARVHARNGRLYTAAFILCAADAFGMGVKYRNHLALWQRMFVRDRLADRILASGSLRQIYEDLMGYPLVGPFMAYQLAIDLNYSELVNFDENDFTQPGPGALRGIAKAFVSTGGLSVSDTILWMVDNQQREFDRLGLAFPGLFGRPLHAIDCQGLFCEFDKYCRVARPELKSNRVRIKQPYRPSIPLPKLFLPPKWGLPY